MNRSIYVLAFTSLVACAKSTPSDALRDDGGEAIECDEEGARSYDDGPCVSRVYECRDGYLHVTESHNPDCADGGSPLGPRPDASPPIAAGECPGGRRAIAECDTTLLSADCGAGAGYPVFACSADAPTPPNVPVTYGARYCLWFPTGCIAEGFEEQACDSSFAYAYGKQPWTRAREANVHVVIDDTLPIASTASAIAGFHGETLVVQLRPSTPEGGVELAGERLYAEVFEDGANGRVCASRFTDALAACEDIDVASDCATAGTFRLRALPEPGDPLDDLHGHLDVTFASRNVVLDF